MSGWLSDKGWAVNLGSPGPIGNVTPSTGKFTTLTATQDVVIATAGKGINFSAVTPPAGMTSQLLADYEEGTWTPNQGAGLVIVGTFSSSGLYTKIGRQVTVKGKLSGSTSVACNQAGVLCSNLPFNSNGEYIGSITNSNINGTGAALTNLNFVYSSVALGAVSSIFFTVTYTV